jgi:hypothetical protein
MECLATPFNIRVAKVAGKGLRQVDTDLVFALFESLLLTVVRRLGNWRYKATVDSYLFCGLDWIPERVNLAPLNCFGKG